MLENIDDGRMKGSQTLKGCILPESAHRSTPGMQQEDATFCRREAGMTYNEDEEQTINRPMGPCRSPCPFTCSTLNGKLKIIGSQIHFLARRGKSIGICMWSGPTCTRRHIYNTTSTAAKSTRRRLFSIQFSHESNKEPREAPKCRTPPSLCRN